MTPNGCPWTLKGRGPRGGKGQVIGSGDGRVSASKVGNRGVRCISELEMLDSVKFELDFDHCRALLEVASD